MKIAKVTCWRLRVPTTFPLLKETFYYFAEFVEVETDNGLKGHAMVAFPIKWGIREYINHEVAPNIIGMDPMRTEDVQTNLFWTLSPRYFSGIWNCSASLIDIALWDIKGKATGQPVWKLLGGARSRVPAYISLVSRYSQEELAECAKMMVADGHDKLKIELGKESSVYSYESHGLTTDEDINRDAGWVCAVRDAVGDKVALMIDGNQKYSYTQALRMAKLVEPYNVTFFEDAGSIHHPR